MSLVEFPQSRQVSGAVIDAATAERIRTIYEDGTPENTRVAYERDMSYVRAWCAARGVAGPVPMDPETAVLFVVDHAKGPPEDVDRRLVEGGAKRDFGPHAISTVRRRVAVLATAHALAKSPNPFAAPEVRDLLSRSRKAAVKNGWRPRRKEAAHGEVLEALLATCGTDAIGLRDRALLLFGFATGGRRRSEIAEASVDRLRAVGVDFVYQLGVTKTTQGGDAGPKPLKGRAATAMRAWLDHAGVVEGPIFRAVDRFGRIGAPIRPKAVWKIVRRRAKLAGLDPRRYGGHSMRSGFMTECGIRGISLADAMALSEHRTTQVAIGYYQAGEGLRNSAADLMG